MYAEGLTLGGLSDWRLPNIKELQSINDERIINPSISTTYFPSIGIKKYWSSTTLPNQTTRAWYLSTQFGITTYELKTARQSVMCVRGNSSNTTALNAPNAPVLDVKIFPNPIKNKVIQFEIGDNSKDLNIHVVDNQGRVLITQNYKAYHYDRFISMPILDLNSGIYWLNLSNGGQTIAQQIMVIQP
jgi:hypothetical protein